MQDGRLVVDAMPGTLQDLQRAYGAAYDAGDYSRSLAIAKKAHAMAPDNALILMNLAVSHLRLDDFDDAIDFTLQALSRMPENFVAYDALSHAYGEKGNVEAVREWGLKALTLRDRQFARPPDTDCSMAPLPEPPALKTRQHNIIAFSLFGNRARYCETAILNAKAQATVFPEWTCLFYVDETVPASVLERLTAEGAHIRVVSGALKRWPPTMWRFAAADIPGMHRVLFRDADSLISSRERILVDEWVSGDRQFHHIRDWHTHTELLHAGLWGMTAGALPSMEAMVARYLAKPLASAHFADQYFLREQVWPHARRSLLAHDSLFGFHGGKPHPAGRACGDDHIGANVANGGFRIKVPVPDGTTVVWELHERIKAAQGAPDARRVCRYASVTRGGEVMDHLPRPYLERLGRDMRVVLLPPPGWRAGS
ncbi:tetratricopeptide repeat protein [Martelella limonii]|uniref:tetratricopeptide repeat protein n=1 Tax=Martelella limonii TaxID=1647649 RepID=UPI0015807CE4|nr:tetratricopeptide repeat protein [Martelella limonii]